jgi:predicted PolB exonuclease-like 3'-5' exonuclease
MIRDVKDRVWAFDCEWIPDPLSGRLVYEIPASVTSPREIMEVMWERGGATEEDPTPYLKTVLCRVVSIAAVERRVFDDGKVALNLLSLPHHTEDSEQARERNLLETFLTALGETKPQLVGYNSRDADLRILIQRGLVLGISAPGFSARPEKPWLGVDYFARTDEWHVDLRQIVGGFGRSVPSLNELATVSGIPGKMEVEGNQVAQLWLEGRLKEIVDYNEFDALTTYLVWLRLAHFAGHFDADDYQVEQQRVRDLLVTEAKSPKHAHLERYLAEWQRLEAICQTR